MKRRILLIIIPVLLITIGLFFFGINVYRKNYKNFLSDGYIIDVESQNKYYFAKDNKYKINTSTANVTFEDGQKQEVKIPETTFIHYVDGSISSFKKSVVLNLDTLEGNTYQYYNFFNGSVLSKIGDEYHIKYMDNQLIMKNFLLKIDEGKYMIVAKHMAVNLGEETKTIDNNYLEINYLDGNIIRLDNQEISLQNISSNLSINIDDLKIDLINKKILLKNKALINLGEITIDSDDNIDIVQDEDNMSIQNQEDDSNSINPNNNTGNGNNDKNSNKNTIFPKVSNGIIEVDEQQVEEIIEKNAAIKDATFSLQNFYSDSNTLETEIKIADPEATLSGAVTIKVIRNDTNQVVYYKQDSSGSTKLDIAIENLQPDTNYTLIVNSDYIKNEMTYNRDFIQKTFVTTPVGIELEKSYVTTDGINFIINKKSYSEIKELSYTLTAPNGTIVGEPGIIDFSTDTTHELQFYDLQENTNYTLKLHDFKHDNIYVVSTENIEETVKTLKRKPIIGTTPFTVDKQNSKFVFYLANIKDLDNGVISYSAEIYETNGTYVSTKTTSTNDKLEIAVDDEIIKRNTAYRIYLFLLFNDNEKTYEIPIGSEEVNLNAKKMPLISFEAEEIKSEHIKGVLTINDSSNVIDATKKITYLYESTSLNTGTQIDEPNNVESLNNSYKININVNNLRSEDSYLFTVRAYVDLDDGNQLVETTIGQFIVQTTKPETMRVEWDDNYSNTSAAFMVKAKLFPYETYANTDFEASIMENLTIQVYSNDKYDLNSDCSPSNNCWERVLYDENKKPYESDLKDLIYDNWYTITPETLGFTNEDFGFGLFTIKIKDAKDYTIYQNELPIVESTIVKQTNSGSGSNIIKENFIRIEPILYGTNENAELNPDTIIGYHLTPLLNTSNIDINTATLTYHIYNTNGEIIATIDGNAANDFSINTYFADITGYERGKSYSFDYTITASERGTETSPRSETVYPLRQAPEFNIYLSSRTKNNTIYKYTLKDTDNAIQDNQVNYYIRTDSNVYTKPLTKNSTEEQTLEIEAIDYGRFSLYRMINYNDEKPQTRVDDIYFYFQKLNDNFGGFTYFVEQDDEVPNSAYVNISLDDNSKSGFVVAANLLLEAGTETVALNNQQIENNKIRIDFDNIKRLMGKGTINVSVEIIYDTGIYGLNAYKLNPDGEVIIQTNIDNITIDSQNVFKQIADFNLLTNPNINLLVNGEEKNINYIPNKGYIIYESKDVMLKKAGKINGTCSTNCNFEFESITPSFDLNEDNIKELLKSATIKPTISNIDESLKSSIVINLSISKKNGYTCNIANATKINNISYEDLTNGYKIENLDLDTTYCLKFTYKNSSTDTNEKNFYYPSTRSYENTYIIKTLASVNISNTSVTYQTINNNNQEGRYLYIHYNVGVLEGYDGLKYELYNDQNLVNVNIPSDTIETIANNNGSIDKYINILGNLPNKTSDGETIKYTLKIIPYIEDEGDLEASTKDFNYSISKANFTFIRKSIETCSSSSTNSSDICFRVKIRDYGNSLYNSPERLKLYIRKNNGVEEEIQNVTLTSINNVISVTNNIIVACEENCTIIAKYKEDIINDGNYIEKVIEKKYSTNNDIILGDVSIVSSERGIILAFGEYYNINLIDTIEYTINFSDGTQISNNDASFRTRADDSDYIELVLAENIVLSSGEYHISLLFTGSVNGQIFQITFDNIRYIKS